LKRLLPQAISTVDTVFSTKKQRPSDQGPDVIRVSNGRSPHSRLRRNRERHILLATVIGPHGPISSSGAMIMAWTTPTLVEICIGLEINGYLPAEF
jgi:coenzyme PQQ precursor peptide PqqA